MASTLRRFFGQGRPILEPRRTPPATSAGSWFESKRPRHAPVGLPRDFLGDTVDEKFRPLLKEPQVIDAIKRDDVPIPASKDRENYYENSHLSYWLSGLADLREVRRLVPSASFTHVLDFGGATGRFARHVSGTVTIADLNHNHVLWCGEHFRSNIRAVKVSEYCHFPLADASVSLCVGLSVFTHIDAYETGWLAEINRVLQPGGYAYFTICTEDTWSKLGTSGSMSNMRSDPEFAALYAANPTMPSERVIIDHKPGTVFHCCNTFLHTDYIRRVWGKWFKVVDMCHGWKTAVVLRKPS